MHTRHWILLALSIGSHPVAAALIQVPQDYASIQAALDQTAAADTVLVHRGHYDERLILPGHDFLLVSDYYFTQDSLDLLETVIDASIYAEEDTASVLTIMGGNTRSTVVAGFTLTGGHGYQPGDDVTQTCCGGARIDHSSPTLLSNIFAGNQSYWTCAIEMTYTAARVAHCRFEGNVGGQGVVAALHPREPGDSVLIEWNDFGRNDVHPDFPFPGIHNPGVYTQQVLATVRFNRFHDYDGWNVLAVESWLYPADVYANVFERLTARDLADAVCMAYAHAGRFRDNVFRDCDLGHAGMAIWDTGDQTGWQDQSIIERNWFENLRNDGYGVVGIILNRPYVHLAENVFLNCRGGRSYGLILIQQIAPGGCRGNIERNHFFHNNWVSDPEPGNALLYSMGTGPLCNIRENWFEANHGAAAVFDSEFQMVWDASENYWGSADGPYDEDENPGGQGDTSGVGIAVTPWLTSPPNLNAVWRERLTILAHDWSVEQAYPNPFNAITTLRILSPKPHLFEVSAYNTLGQRVARIWQGLVPRDEPVDVRWNADGDDGRSVASGIYYLVVRPAGPGDQTPKSLKVILLK